MENKQTQIPKIRQTLEQSERQFIQDRVAHPHDHGLLSTEEHHAMKSGTRTHATNSPKPNTNKAVNNSPPPQVHLLKERAREEAQLCYAEQRNKDIQPSPSQKSRYGFWDVVDTINATGDFVAHSVMDMLNPIKQFNNMWEDANESVRFFREGDIRHGVISTGKTALGALYFLPAFRGVELAVKGGAVVGSRLGFFRNTTTSVNKIAQIESKHPLAGLSSDNVVRLVNELGLETPRDQLVLWSGLGRGNEGIRLSQQYVAKHGGITLEMTPGGSWLNDLNANFPFSMQESAYIWGEVSKLLTKNASGQVRSLLGQVRPQSIYASQELLEVRNNLKILGIEEIYLRPKLDTILK